MKSKKLLCLVALSMIISQGFLLQVVHAQTSTGQTVSAHRLAGENRYDTSIAISQAGWDKSDTVILTSGEKFADSLCAGPLAKKYNAPILLTTSTSINDNTLKELTRLQTKNIIIVGGTGSVSANVENQLKSSGLTNIDRIGGKDRYETSVMIAKKLDKTDKAIIASGENFPDALSIAAVASKLGIPILLSNKDSLSQDAEQFIESNNIKQTYIVGGQGVLSSSIDKSLHSPVRLSGSDRYETNLAILKQFYKDLNFDSIYLASGGGAEGNEFADALSGAALACKTSSPILLTDKSIDKDLNEFIKTKLNVETKAVALGGKAVLSDSLVKNIMDEKASVTAAKVYDKAGSYTGDTINGLAIISAPDVQLKDTTINGDLLITSAVGEGSVGLNNVNVTGKIIVNGGGGHSVEADNSKAKELVVDKPIDGGIRVVLGKGTNIPSAKIYSDAILDMEEDALKKIKEELGFTDTVIDYGAHVTASGFFKNVKLEGFNSALNARDAFINKLEIDPSSMGANISLDINSAINKIIAEAGCNVTGQGKINNAVINAPNTTIEQEPGNVQIKSGITANIAGEIKTGTSSSSSGGSSGGNYVSYKTITTAAAIEDINVDNGTSLSAISLPQSLTITLNDGTTTSAGITWDNGTPSYDGNTTGIYEFTGNIAVPQGVTNTNNITAKVRIVVGNPYAGSKFVTTAAAIEDKNVDNGTSLSAISLPQNLNITLNDGTSTSAGITWDNGTPTYDGNTTGIYEFTGTISLPEGVINPGNVKAKVKVVVGNANNESGGGNSPGNIMNGGFAVEKDGWIYYSNVLDKEKLYKIKTDGTGKVKLNDDENSYSINIDGDNIYYIVDGGKINKIKTDGSSESTITEAYVNRMNVVGDKIYYMSYNAGNDDYDTEGYLYRINLDGSGSEKISEEKVKMFNVIGDHVYYISANDVEGNTENGKIYSINLDGTGKTGITEDAATYMNVAEDGVYYANKDDGDKIYKVNLDGSGKTKVSDAKADDIIYKDGWLYSENITDKTLYKIKSDGSQNTVLLQGSNYIFNISGDWIYYVDVGDISKIQDIGNVVIYRMKTDGTNRQGL